MRSDEQLRQLARAARKQGRMDQDKAREKLAERRKEYAALMTAMAEFDKHAQETIRGFNQQAQDMGRNKQRLEGAIVQLCDLLGEPISLEEPRPPATEPISNGPTINGAPPPNTTGANAPVPLIQVVGG